ncbi:hypothetical protein N7509_009727 [Penicillium cosmopolitanum]|uniref:Uncharacterized protein n=1 Tax=Penicillium cosmopolitanum TaxID=1131564 RepID=A0A9X0B3Y3_9EURO|nr:uncharacterized protein N7509_009727 [Penicillium cosmopolitanum]KAJ5387186.1 hypothetical protein N7509_009727 [Penicillium cosmopolitanum]
MTQVALITGGTSGIGFSVAEALSNLRNWQINIIGVNEEKGQKAAATLLNTSFYKANVSQYEELAVVFGTVFNKAQRLDFVFANAGIPEYTDLFANQSSSGVPPKPGLDLLDINLNGAIYASYLAVNYFRRSPESVKGTQSLLLTASIGGLYPCMLTPVYSSSKHALIGFVRSIGNRLFKEGIRVNTICPGVVKTPLLNEELLSNFPADILIPIEAVTDVAMKIVLEDGINDSKGLCVTADKFHSRAIHVTGKGLYFIDQPPISDEEARTTWDCMMGWR